MLGSIIGDIVGSIYEGRGFKSKFFNFIEPYCTFTDDTVCTIAIADSILHKSDFISSLKKWCRDYPDAGYGQAFYNWVMSDSLEPYNSWGNGAAMRVSPIGFAFNTLEEVLLWAKKSAEVTHNHPEGIKGAQATAAAVFWARTGYSKSEIKREIENNFGYDLSRSLDQIRPNYKFEISSQKTVPEAIIAFLESNDFEDAIRNAISIGGDADTLACIAGGIAQAFYKQMPSDIICLVKEIIPSEFNDIVNEFNSEFNIQ